MSRQRQQIEVFGVSLLDMMTCAFGAILLLFIMQRAVSGGRIDAVRTEAAVSEAALAAVTATRVRERDLLDQIRRTAPGPPTLGVPVAPGEVVFLLDMSRSMVEYGPAKRDIALRLLEQSLASPSGPTHALVIGFASTVEVIVDWTSLADADSASANRVAWAAEVASRVRTRFSPTPDTDLAGALKEAVGQLARRGANGTIVLLSDGMHFVAGTNSAAEVVLGGDDLVTLVREIGRRAGFPDRRPIIHAVGLFDWPARPLNLSDTTDLVAFRRALTARLEAGGSEQVGPAGDAAAARDLLAATPTELNDPLGGLSIRAAQFASPAVEIELGDTLFRITDAFGGRFIGIPIDPFMLPD